MEILTLIYYNRNYRLSINWFYLNWDEITSKNYKNKTKQNKTKKKKKQKNKTKKKKKKNQT